MTSSVSLRWKLRDLKRLPKIGMLPRPGTSRVQAASSARRARSVTRADGGKLWRLFFLWRAPLRVVDGACIFEFVSTQGAGVLAARGVARVARARVAGKKGVFPGHVFFKKGTPDPAPKTTMDRVTAENFEPEPDSLVARFIDGEAVLTAETPSIEIQILCSKMSSDSLSTLGRWNTEAECRLPMLIGVDGDNKQKYYCGVLPFGYDEIRHFECNRAANVLEDLMYSTEMTYTQRQEMESQIQNFAQLSQDHEEEYSKWKELVRQYPQDQDIWMRVNVQF